MNRIVGIHEIELKPGVSEAEFEQAIGAVIAQPWYSGWHLSLMKGDRSTRRGKYALLFEIESVQARERFTTDDGETEECKQYDASHPELIAAFEHVQSLIVDPHLWTDYQVL